MIFFTSDTHFNHSNIIKYCGRPFADCNHMEEGLIERWNEVVKPEDDVYHLGDFAFCGTNKALEILHQLNGRIFLIRGNHDNFSQEVRDQFEWVKDYYRLTVKNFFGGKTEYNARIVLCHYPIESWDGMSHGSWHLHGHCHGSLKRNNLGKRLDVGVDCHHYYPLSFLEVYDIMASRNFQTTDGHGNDDNSFNGKQFMKEEFLPERDF